MRTDAAASSSSAVTPQPKRAVSPIREAMEMRPRTPSKSKTTTTSNEAASITPDEVTTFRTNITIAVMALCVVLMGAIAVNSGSNASLTRPRAVVFVIDGLNTSALKGSVSLHRAPFLSMLQGIGTGTFELSSDVCQRQISAKPDSGDVIREMFTGGSSGGRASVLRAASAAGFSIALVGEYPLLNAPAGHGCGALNAECAASCLDGDSTASRCNYKFARAVKEAQEASNATVDAFVDGHHVVIGNFELEGDDDFSRNASLFKADAAIGRSVMRLVELTAEQNENLLVVIAGGSATSREAFFSIVAFKGGATLRLDKITQYPNAPRLADVAATLGYWLEVDAPASLQASSRAICGTGAQPTDCASA